MQQKIAIVGSGHVAKAAAMAFLMGKVPFFNLIVIVRPETSTEDIRFFHSRKIETTEDMSRITTCSHVLLAVTPRGAGNVLSRINAVDFSDSMLIEVVSFISGLDESHIEKVVPVGMKVVVGTINTNIEYCRGIVCATNFSLLFGHFAASFITEDFRSIVSSIVSVGSANAFDYQALYLGYTEKNWGMSLSDWLRGLCALTKFGCFKYDTATIPEQYKTVCEYVAIKSRIFTSNGFFYTDKQAKQRACDTLQSAIATLLAMHTLDLKPLTANCILVLQERVITKGGCTAEGVYSIKTVEDLNDEACVTDAFVKVLAAASSFKRIVLESIQHSKERVSVLVES